MQSGQPAPKKRKIHPALIVVIALAVLIGGGIAGFAVYENKQIDADWESFEYLLGINYLDLEDNKDEPLGVLVEEVESGGAADEIGITEGDIITEFDGRKVTSKYRLEDQVLSHYTGDTVDIAVERKTDSEYKRMEGAITLGGGSSSVLEYEDGGSDTAEPTGSDNSGSTKSAAGKCGDNAEWSFKNGTLTISGTGDMDSYNGLDSGDRAAPWADVKNDITKVVIERGIISIGAYAFAQCKNLTDVEIPAGVKDMGIYAFQDCESLKEIVLPKGLKYKDKFAFNGCDVNVKYDYSKTE